jgi:hypothetical protein
MSPSYSNPTPQPRHSEQPNPGILQFRPFSIYCTALALAELRVMINYDTARLKLYCIIIYDNIVHTYIDTYTTDGGPPRAPSYCIYSYL